MAQEKTTTQAHKLFTDGGSRGNPGPAATGQFLFDPNDKLLAFDGSYLGNATNNVAEYQALLDGLKLAKKNKVKMLICYLDSELVVKQLNREYKVKHEDMKKLFLKVMKETESFDGVAFKHVPRAENKFADRMVNVVLDTRN